MTIRNVMTVLYHTGRGNPVVISSIPIIPYHTVTDHPYSTAAILTPSSPSPALSLSLSLSLFFPPSSLSLTTLSLPLSTTLHSLTSLSPIQTPSHTKYYCISALVSFLINIPSLSQHHHFFFLFLYSLLLPACFAIIMTGFGFFPSAFFPMAARSVGRVWGTQNHHHCFPTASNFFYR